MPYKAVPPISGLGLVEFQSTDDIWDVVSQLYDEVYELNKKGNSFDPHYNVALQISHFTCPNYFYDRGMTRDIERYVYSTSLGIPAYPGSFGEQPNLWIQKHFTLKAAFAMKEKRLQEKHGGSSRKHDKS